MAIIKYCTRNCLDSLSFLLFVCIIVHLMYLLVFLFKLNAPLYFSILPESPRWLVSKGHYEHAERILRRIAKANGKNFDTEEFQRLIDEERKVFIQEIIDQNICQPDF